MKRLRILFCLALYAAGFLGNQAMADAYIDVPNAHQLLEHLVRHSDELMTEVNLTRANQFTVINPVLQDIRTQGGWGAAMYGRMLVDPRNPSRIPEYFIGQIVNDFRMNTILLYDLWWKTRMALPPPQMNAALGAFRNQFIVTDYSYNNAIAATYFYIEALRRSYVIRGAQGRCWSQEVLVRRLMKLDRLAWELRELMMSVRYAASFRFPVRPVCIECTYRPYRVNVQVNTAQNFIPFPFNTGNDTYAPSDIRPVAPGATGTGGPAYDARYWNERFNNIDNSYINGYRPNVPGASTLPGNYDERPYTPTNPGVGGQNPGVAPVQPGGQNPGVVPSQPIQNPTVPGNQDIRDPLARPVNPGGAQPTNPGGMQPTNPGTQPGYPVPGNGDVAPSSDYRYGGN